ncbi:MAG: hypothetical protein HKM87_03360 [Ignavibacteriaceae bacterium]|nr:hypothetical protein [Ignavibacteriaceae bacterium]
MKNNSINKLWLQIIFLFTYCIFIYPQQETVALKDSVLRYQGFIPPIDINYQFDDKFLYNNPEQFVPEFPLYDDSSTIWLRTELALSSSIPFAKKKDQEHFTLALYQQHLQDSKFDMVRYVLGMAQLSAVGYLAYKHIKKYGFR